MLIQLKLFFLICLIIILYLFKFCKSDEKELKKTFNQLFPDLFMVTTESAPTTIYNIFNPNNLFNFIKNKKTNSINFFYNNNDSEKIAYKTHQQIKASKTFNTELNTLSAIRIKLNEPFFQETARLFCKKFNLIINFKI